MEKSKFDEYTESVYKLIQIPDTEAGSDAVGAVTPAQAPAGDLFTQAADRIIAQLGLNKGSEDFDKAEPVETDSEGEEASEGEEESSEDDELEITHAVDGIKISGDGIEFHLSGVIVNKIRELFNDGPKEEADTEGETESEDAESDTAEDLLDSGDTEEKEEDKEDETKKESIETSDENITEAKKSGKKVNPWAVCTAKVGRDDKEKYERCVMGVKAKHNIKK